MGCAVLAVVARLGSAVGLATTGMEPLSRRYVMTPIPTPTATNHILHYVDCASRMTFFGSQSTTHPCFVSELAVDGPPEEPNRSIILV